MNQKQIFELISKFDDSRLAELKIETEDFKITMKSAEAGKASLAMLPPAAPSQIIQTGLPLVEESTQQKETPSTQGDTEIIPSPLVGTFYRSPAPDAPAFVDEGSLVSAGDSICIIEAMKIMNKLEADFSCEIVKILAENGQMVEFGAPLFEVRRS